MACTRYGRVGEVGAVVGAEEDDRLPVDVELLQESEDSADVRVEPGDHSSILLCVVGPVSIGVRLVVRHFVLAVWHGVGHVEEEGPPVIVADELESEPGEVVVDPLPLIPAHVTPDDLKLFVVPYVFGEIGVGVSLVQEAEPLVEPLSVRYSGCAGLAESPLAGDAGRVSGSLEHFGHGYIFFQQRHATLRWHAGNPR